jgi:myosin-5
MKAQRWCPSEDPDILWEKGEVEATLVSPIRPTQVRVLLEGDDEAETFDLKETHPVEQSHLLNLDNIADMDNLHVAPLLNLLRRRHQSDIIYTRTADILISINPFKTIEHLYLLPSDAELLSRSHQDPGDGTEGPPHVYRCLHRNNSSCVQVLT